MAEFSKVVLEKRALRARLIEVRDRLDAAARERAGREAARLLFDSSVVQGKETVMLYASIRSEVDTRWLIEAARDRGMRIALPRVVKEQQRIEAVWVEGPDDLEPGTMGIREPRAQLPAIRPGDLDLIVVPGLGFDRLGYRIGYGAGHYDRFLPLARQAVWVGLTYDQCLVDVIPREDHDQPMHFILTGSKLLAAGSH